MTTELLLLMIQNMHIWHIVLGSDTYYLTHVTLMRKVWPRCTNMHIRHTVLGSDTYYLTCVTLMCKIWPRCTTNLQDAFITILVCVSVTWLSVFSTDPQFWCVCVCEWVSVCVCVCVCVHTCMHACMLLCVCVYVHACVRACTSQLKLPVQSVMVVTYWSYTVPFRS